MPTLSREYRKLLENTVVSARRSAVAGARKALTALRVGDKESPTDPDQKALCHLLRVHGRQLGDSAQETRRLEQACAYEHWHRMLFARFLAENNLLVHPDYGVAMSLGEIQETARAQNQDWLRLASDYAQRMLLAVFRPDDPVLRLTMPPETRQELEESLAGLPAAIFIADDSLGWVYQFWQRDEKERVNKSEVKIGADELSPVTQLFTEDYMVLFLLHNTLGAWWAAKRRAEGKGHLLSGYEWTYLRLNEDGAPAAGGFDGWPRTARELRVLDPCMGSGHFLVFALPILALMRQEEEGLSLAEAVHATLAENLFGLELDARCSQIAAFNLALTAWRMVGRPMELPSLNLACSGLGIHASEESWLALAGGNRNVRFTLKQSYELFQKAPTLGSLIDPTRERLAFVEFDQVWPVLEAALSAEQVDDDSRELAIAAKGVLAAARMLAGQFTLVATNVPYLGRGKQSVELAHFCKDFHPDAKADLATCFVERCLSFCEPEGSCALVTAQNWWFLGSFKAFRRTLLTSVQIKLIVALGEEAWQFFGDRGPAAALMVLENCRPAEGHVMVGIDALPSRSIEEKVVHIRSGEFRRLSQRGQTGNPDHRFTTDEPIMGLLLQEYSDSYQGVSPADVPHFGRCFWEVKVGSEWRFWQSAVEETKNYGGRSFVLWWNRDLIEAVESGQAFVRGERAWGRMGVACRQMRVLSCCVYTGEAFDTNTAVIIPREESHLLAIWAYCSSPEFAQAVRRIDKKVNVTNASLVKVPFDIVRWQREAAEKYPNGLPKPSSNDPTQWLFTGDLRSTEQLLQVAVAHLIGYRWPRESGVAFEGAPVVEMARVESHPDTDGIVCLSSLSGEQTAADRMRVLLAEAFGADWSAAKLSDLTGSVASLELWLRDRFFAEHCALFHSRPFVWHIWDGRNDGFHALINYHRLAGPNGEGRKTLEKLIYTSLGDWLNRQQAEVDSGADGAEGRLAAAKHLKSELTNILNGEPPYDLFIRWKPLHEQPIGWEPDLNDGVRLNMRPWLYAKPYKASKKDACILRVTPIKLPLGKDRGKEPKRDETDFPWFDKNTERTNDIHLSIREKQEARERRQKEVR